jgi:hypothetical protein
MYGELTDKETVARVEYALEHQQHDQFEILLYKKNSEYYFDSLYVGAFIYFANEHFVFSLNLLRLFDEVCSDFLKRV